MLGVGPAEQVADRLPPEQRAPAPSLMLWPIVDHVAALAERREIGVRVVRGVVIPMDGSEDHPGPAGPPEDVGICRDPDPTPLSIAPPTGIRVPPAAVAEVVDHPARAAVRSPHSSSFAQPLNISGLTTVAKKERSELCGDGLSAFGRSDRPNKYVPLCRSR